MEQFHAFLNVRKIMNKTLMHTLCNTHKILLLFLLVNSFKHICLKYFFLGGDGTDFLRERIIIVWIMAKTTTYWLLYFRSWTKHKNPQCSDFSLNDYTLTLMASCPIRIYFNILSSFVKLKDNDMYRSCIQFTIFYVLLINFLKYTLLYRVDTIFLANDLMQHITYLYKSTPSFSTNDYF